MGEELVYVSGAQPEGFLCISSDSTHSSLEAWEFSTFSLETQPCLLLLYLSRNHCSTGVLFHPSTSSIGTTTRLISGKHFSHLGASSIVLQHLKSIFLRLIHKVSSLLSLFFFIKEKIQPQTRKCSYPQHPHAVQLDYCLCLAQLHLGICSLITQSTVSN